MTRTIALAGVWLLGYSLVSGSALAQEPAVTEVKAEVPALDAMHEIIMPLWHVAWPAKDVKALAGMMPAIEKHVAAVSAARLPGILREKQSAWDANVEKLQAIAQEYKAAVASGNGEALLKQAEALHAQYETLVRVIRPVLKEIEDFHATLYVLYHYEMKPFAMAKVAASVETLKVKMATLDMARLPDHLKARTAAFDAQRARLSKAVDALVALLPSKDATKISPGIELMHAEYEKLERSIA